jgi:hypothetical protein
MLMLELDGWISFQLQEKKAYLMINNFKWIKWNEVSIQNPWVGFKKAIFKLNKI